MNNTTDSSMYSNQKTLNTNNMYSFDYITKLDSLYLTAFSLPKIGGCGLQLKLCQLIDMGLRVPKISSVWFGSWCVRPASAAKLEILRPPKQLIFYLGPPPLNAGQVPWADFCATLGV